MSVITHQGYFLKMSYQGVHAHTKAHTASAVLRIAAGVNALKKLAAAPPTAHVPCCVRNFKKLENGTVNNS